MDKASTKGGVIQENPPDLSFGWFGWKPKWLQVFNKAIWVLVFMTLANTFQSMTINGLIGTVITSLETRFDFASSQSSWIVSAYDISTIPMLILVSYFGSSSHRTRWSAMGLIGLVIGTIIFVLPHYTTPVYSPGGNTEGDDGLCSNRTGIDACEEGEGTNLQDYLAMFIVGRLFHGLGAVPLYTICVTYLDDCLSKEKFSLYIAIFYAGGILGPALGYIMGGYLLTFFTDFPSVDVDEIGLTEDDPAWVGAWWPGFLAGATGIFLISIPLFGYSRDIPGAAAIRATKKSEAHNASDDDMSAGEMAVSWKELPSYFKALATNPTYVFLTFFVSCDSLLMGGFTAFGPKYVQTQFSITAAVAGMVFGGIAIPGGAGGTVIGGVLVNRFKMSCKTIMKWEAVFTLIIMCTAGMFFIICDPVDYAGINISYNETSLDGIGLASDCNVACDCSQVALAPVCGYNNIQYFSACHAGCTDMVEDGTTTLLYNCTCLPDAPLDVAAAENTVCSSNSCTLMPLFAVLFFIAMFFLFVCSSMNISATIRCVPARQRSLAVGIQWIALRLLGTVPGPLAFGAAFDAACELWQDDCGNQGSCVFYSNERMALLLFAISASVKGASVFFIFFAWKMYKPPQDDDNVTEVDGQKMKEITDNEIHHLNGGPTKLHGNGAIDSPVFERDSIVSTNNVTVIDPTNTSTFNDNSQTFTNTSL